MSLIFFLLVWLITGSFWKAALIWFIGACVWEAKKK